jgi:hypothetical protein
MEQQNNNQDEAIKWVNLSEKFGKYEPFLIPVIQGLGRLSMQLDVMDGKILEENNRERATIESSTILTNVFMQSYLWVLGAYEAIRTLHQRVGNVEKSENTKKELAEEIKKVKHLFEKIRIPLAKMETPNRYKGNPAYSPIAYPILDTKRGAAWHLGVGMFISRKELSEEFLKMVNLIF